jgi:hypothetical protein
MGPGPLGKCVLTLYHLRKLLNLLLSGRLTWLLPPATTVSRGDPDMLFTPVEPHCPDGPSDKLTRLALST